jgi:hypothetical protein
MGVVQIDLPLHLFFDELGDRKIRFAEVALDDPLPLLFDLPDVWADLECVFGVDEAHALRQESHGKLLSSAPGLNG